jgi:aerobic-type carbon monoxide dehydrogenase small subunit (CoxS/CutS family)
MATGLVITVNGKRYGVHSTPDTPLLYVLRNELGLRGLHFGCGLSQCGACAVLLGKTEIRSCVTPVGGVVGQQITTLEGLPQLWARERSLAPAPATTALHPLQQAWIDEQVPQCGYCQSGMIIQAADLLMHNPHPTDTEIRTAMDGHLCRCGTHMRIIRAIKRAAAVMAAS